MIRLAVFLVDGLRTAEDVVQDAFAAICRRHGSRLDSLQDAHAYLHTSEVNAANPRSQAGNRSRAPQGGPGVPF
ncbi:hypothetical protein [Streptomyces sp. HNM1019]|uniref:hypothetical protein n=1 Tax=Streptomyces sp. HNM1019 TaxID=3424717 RepID=UPI003D76A903